jgi:hypothetical protein
MAYIGFKNDAFWPVLNVTAKVIIRACINAGSKLLNFEAREREREERVISNQGRKLLRTFT